MPLNEKLLKLAAALEFRDWLRRPLIWTTHLGLFLFSGASAFLLRYDFNVPPGDLRYLWFGLLIWLPLKSVGFRLLGLDRGWWRFVSIDDVTRICFGNFIGSLAASFVIRFAGPPGFPRSVYVLDFVICFLSTSAVRVAVRMACETQSQGGMEGEKRTIIYGAGAAGIALLREIRANPKLSYAIKGFIDDDQRKVGLTFQSVRVLGTGADLARKVTKHRIELVLIAIPAASGPQMSRILRLCHDAGVTSKTIPGLAESIEGNGLAHQIRDVAVEDLLGRTPVKLQQHQILGTLKGKVVMVTGAAGSIGSELCRQIARFQPAAIIGFDIAESPLFDLDHGLSRSFPQTSFYPEIGSIQNRARLDEVFRQYTPRVVYHAAAYKHVPLMEAHLFEAVENNVLGTYNVALAAAEHGAESFVMISSDKAVRPTNIMGATKRVSELLLLALQNGHTKYVSVRFGNVLGSNGSVIPTFKRQIASGGPVTVTHPEMRRFFMTVSEACQLVLQASAVAAGGQICVLDMGEPVKIVDLAKNLILLSGLKPDQDIKIAFTGMRPGEKLYEELSTLLEETVPTGHEKIRVHLCNGMPEGNFMTWLDCLREVCETRDAGRLVTTLKEIVHDYSPSAHLLKRILARPQGVARIAS